MTAMTLVPQSARAIKSRGSVVRITWQQQSPPPHEFVAVACPEEDGGYSAFAANYPGVISQGETLDEVRENIAEAFLAVLESKRKHGEEMEFSYESCPDITADCIRLRIKIDA